VVANLTGRDNPGSAATADPYLTRTARATRDPSVTPMAGAKLERLFRIDFVKYTEFFKPFRMMADPKVTMAQVKVKSALVPVDTGDVKVLATSVTASKRNIELIRTEKISSVNRVKYLTRFDAEVSADTSNIPAVHRPVQA
jgi:hypothetical protein